MKVEVVTMKDNCLYAVGDVDTNQFDQLTLSYHTAILPVFPDDAKEGIVRLITWKWDGAEGRFVFDYVPAERVEDGFEQAPLQSLLYHLRLTADSYFEAIRTAQEDADAIDRIVSTALERGDLGLVEELEKHLPVAVETVKQAFVSQVPEKYKTIENAVRYVLRHADRVTRYNIQTGAYYETTLWKMYANLRAKEAGADGWVLGMPLRLAVREEQQLDAIERFAERDDVVAALFGERRSEDARYLTGVFVLYKWGVHPEHPHMNIYVHYNI